MCSASDGGVIDASAVVDSSIADCILAGPMATSAGSSPPLFAYSADDH